MTGVLCTVYGAQVYFIWFNNRHHEFKFCLIWYKLNYTLNGSLMVKENKLNVFCMLSCLIESGEILRWLPNWLIYIFRNILSHHCIMFSNVYIYRAKYIFDSWLWSLYFYMSIIFLLTCWWHLYIIWCVFIYILKSLLLYEKITLFNYCSCLQSKYLLIVTSIVIFLCPRPQRSAGGIQ